MKKVFTSPHRAYMIVSGETLIQFTNTGVMGVLVLDDEKDRDIIKLLYEHPEYNKRFTDKPQTARPVDNIVTGVRSSINTTLDSTVKEEMTAKFREYEALKSQVVKLNGEPKKDADPDLLSRFQILKTELAI